MAIIISLLIDIQIEGFIVPIKPTVIKLLLIEQLQHKIIINT